MNLDCYLELLCNYKAPNIFNPWSQIDQLHDEREDSFIIRLNNLKNYLEQRKDAEYIFVAEALGYNGGHFSGIAMTSERQLLNDKENKIFKGEKTRVSSIKKLTEKNISKKIIESGFIEPTGTMVWEVLTELTKDTYNWINWNTFPFHPYKNNDYLTNRTPDKDEILIAEKFLKSFLEVFNDRKIIAVGRISELVLSNIGEKFIKVRHPANGGKREFSDKLNEYFKNK